MTTHNITPEDFTPHGKVTLNADGGELQMTTNTALYTHFHNNDSPISAYACLPGKYKLPFRIDMTVKIDAPALYLITGKGHVEFATGNAHRGITDILGGDFKPNTHEFDNNLQLGEYVDISVTYGCAAVCVTVNGECRCLSKKDPYIKALKAGELPEEFKDGFAIALACEKRTEMTVKKLSVTEFGGELDIPSQPPEIRRFEYNLPEKPTVEAAVQLLTPELQAKISSIDEYLMKNMKKSLKFKRKIENWSTGGRITYVSPWGFRYKIEIRENYMWHDIGWIAYNTRREVEKYGGRKKADLTNKTLAKLSEADPGFAAEMFERVQECKGCNSGKCRNTWIYEFGGKKTVSCVWDGGMNFKMLPSDFADVRRIIAAIDAVSAE